MALLSLAVMYGTPVDLPPPPPGYAELTQRIGSTQTTLAGNTVMQTVARKKQWTLPYRHLTDAQYATLLGFLDGVTRGLGPFELRRSGDPTVYLVNIVELGNTIPIIGSHHSDVVLQEV